MSITSILQGKRFNELREYIKENVPKKNNFISSTGFPAFSKKIPEKLISITTTTYESALVGELTDYAFCLEVLRYVKKNKMVNFTGFFRQIDQEYERIINVEHENGEKLKHRFREVKIACLEYVYGKQIELEKVVEYANSLNKVEHYHHVRREDRDKFWESFLEPCKRCIVEDVVELIKIFRKCFFENGRIKENSTVVLHPCFGVCTSPVGIADLYADGILYEFKSSKRKGYNWIDVGQVYGYYILHSLTLKYREDVVLAEAVPIKHVDAIALYYSRYGDIEFCDLKKGDAVLEDSELGYLADMMDRHSRERLEEMKTIFAELEWSKAAYRKIKLGEVTKHTPETVGYKVGDTVYVPTRGKAEVLEFKQEGDCWYVILQFESGQVLMGDINKTVQVNWKCVEEHEVCRDNYFFGHCVNNSV